MARRVGVALLAVWCAANAAVALAVIAFTALGRPPPALELLLSPEEVARVEPRALAVVNAQAAIANPLIVALCALVLVLLWKARELPWTVPALAAVLLPVQAAGFWSDGFLGGRNLAANLGSTAVLVLALGLLRGGSAASRGEVERV